MPFYRPSFWVTVLTWSRSTRKGGSLIALTAPSRKKNRFVTIVLPSPVGYQDRPQRIRAIEETWGKEANAIYAVPFNYNASDYTVNGNLPYVLNTAEDDHPPNRPKLLVFPEGMDPLSDAPTFAYAISTVHAQIFHKNLADFVLCGNDYTFVLPDNVCHYLDPKDPGQPLHAGHALVGQGKFPFNSGAIGFILSKATVAQMVRAMEGGLCDQNARHYLTECLAANYQLKLQDTRDDQGRHRFHGYGITRTLQGQQDSWYVDFHKDPQNLLGFSNYSYPDQGRECCSPETTTFHYVQDAETRALYALRTILRGNPKLSDTELQQLVLEKWPKKHKELGGYASPLPPTTEKKLWEDLLHVIRVITPQGSAYAIGC